MEIISILADVIQTLNSRCQLPFIARILAFQCYLAQIRESDSQNTDAKIIGNYIHLTFSYYISPTGVVTCLHHIHNIFIYGSGLHVALNSIYDYRDN
jgi:hypothetical protein